jgi:hypothetical protein
VDGFCQSDGLFDFATATEASLCGVGTDLRASGDYCFGLVALMNLVVAKIILLTCLSE